MHFFLFFFSESKCIVIERLFLFGKRIKKSLLYHSNQTVSDSEQAELIKNICENVQIDEIV